MAARKVLTRAESQAQTRQELLAAAERLFYANGYHSTSLAAIAAEAEIALRKERPAGDYRESLERISERSAELARILETLLEVARRQAGPT